MNPGATTPEAVISLRGVSTRLGQHVVHEGLDLKVQRAEIFALVGGSGSGKSTLLREMILLHRPDAGEIRVLGTELRGIGDDARAAQALERDVSAWWPVRRADGEGEHRPAAARAQRSR